MTPYKQAKIEVQTKEVLVFLLVFVAYQLIIFGICCLSCPPSQVGISFFLEELRFKLKPNYLPGLSVSCTSRISTSVCLISCPVLGLNIISDLLRLYLQTQQSTIPVYHCFECFIILYISFEEKMVSPTNIRCVCCSCAVLPYGNSSEVPRFLPALSLQTGHWMNR